MELCMVLVLPVLGTTTYVSAFIHRKSLEKQWIWELGSVNSAIWAVIFLGLFLAQLLTNLQYGDLQQPPSLSSFVRFTSFIYFGYLFSLNKKIVKFRSVKELALNP